MPEGQRSRCGHCDQGSRPSSSQSSATRWGVQPWSSKRYRDDDSGRAKKREKLEHDLQYHRKDGATQVDKKKDKRRPHEKASRRSSPSPHRRAKVGMRSLPPHPNGDSTSYSQDQVPLPLDFILFLMCLARTQQKTKYGLNQRLLYMASKTLVCFLSSSLPQLFTTFSQTRMRQLKS